MSKTRAQVNAEIALLRGWIETDSGWVAQEGTPSWDERETDAPSDVPPYCSDPWLSSGLIHDGQWMLSLASYTQLPDGAAHPGFWVAWCHAEEASEQRKGMAIDFSEASARGYLANQQGVDNNEPPFDQF